MERSTKIVFVLGVIVCIVYLLFQTSHTPYAWIHPTGKVVPTIFFQGITESQLQVIRYLSDDLFISTTNETFKRSPTKHIPVIHTPWIAPELPEVVPYGQADASNFFVKRIMNYFHDLTENRMQDADIVLHDLSTTETPQSSLCKHSIHIHKVNLGQADDIANHLEKYYACQDHFGKISVILYGVSRGAATTFNALSTYPDIYQEYVKAVILESPFDSISDVLQQRFPYQHRIITWLLSCYTAYNCKGPFPIQLVATFPPSIPVLFITSSQDKMVPQERTEALARALAQRKKNDVYLLKLSSSHHARYMFDSSEDARIYRDVVHAFYHMYGLPYIKEYAQAGIKELQESKLN